MFVVRFLSLYSPRCTEYAVHSEWHTTRFAKAGRSEPTNWTRLAGLPLLWRWSGKCGAVHGPGQPDIVGLNLSRLC